jgi:hypothetical protein
MKRDFDLVREILFYFENRVDSGVDENVQIEGYDEKIIAYHNRILYDAGFIRCESVRSSTSGDRVIRVLPFELTWNGHEFLDKIRSDTIWNNIKAYSKEKGLTLSFNIVNELAKKYLASVMAGA